MPSSVTVQTSPLAAFVAAPAPSVRETPLYFRIGRPATLMKPCVFSPATLTLNLKPLGFETLNVAPAGVAPYGLPIATASADATSERSSVATTSCDHVFETPVT